MQSRKFKRLKKCLIVFAVIIAVIFTIRSINHFRYSSSQNMPESLLSSGDMSDYSLEQEGIKILPLKDNYINALHMVPDNKTSKGLIITFSGSAKGCDYERSVALAKEGYEVMAMFYFGEDNQPESYNNVPLEFFGNFLEYAKANNIDTSELTVIGLSKGAELSLVLSNYYHEEIDNIVLFAPSAYVFQGGDMMAKTSSWSYNNKELPYISLFPNFQNGVKMVSSLFFNFSLAYREHYIDVVAAEDNIELVEIDFSNYKGDILVFAGDDDQLWHSDIMGETIKEKAPKQTQLFIYPNAGHVFLPIEDTPIMALGGTIEANTEAQIQSEKKLLEFLGKNHQALLE